MHEFGTAEELAPGCQRELTIAQTRRTARAAALAVPCLTLCWLLIWTSGPGHGWPLRLLAVHVACVAVTAGLLAAATLAATGPVARRVPVPPGCPWRSRGPAPRPPWPWASPRSPWSSPRRSPGTGR